MNDADKPSRAGLRSGAMGKRVRLTRAGLGLGDETVPLLAGSMHYWLVPPEGWRRCLEAMRAIGFRLVDTYVPWGVHEVGPGRLELGEHDPQRDVAAFLRLAREVGLWAIVRPGPHVNAELTYFGLPERIVWDPACQARTPGQNPVMLPVPPKMFPVPSYASEAFLDEVTRYFHLLGPTLGPLLYPAGPIVLLQVDNEGALYFRDGVFDQDYHPDAIARYRQFLRDRYGTITALAAAYGERPETDELKLASIEPPRELVAERPGELARYLDWAEFQEQLLARAMGRFAAALGAAGLGEVPTTHNFPPAQQTTALNLSLVGETVDLVGLDYYGRASEAARSDIARRTGELALWCDGRDLPAFGCEMGAGFAWYFPPLAERDNAFTVLGALAYGLRGFNAYMAVGRDRWIGAPIDCEGRAGVGAELWRRLCRALEETRFATLRRRVPVRVVWPRLERRLARLSHAFGPANGALLAVMGQGPREACREDDLGLGYAPAIETDTFVGSFEQALEGRGIPYALVGDELGAAALADAAWVVCACSGALDPELARALAAAHARGVRVTIGPRPPRFDAAFREPEGDRAACDWELVERSDPATADAAVARAAEVARLPRWACDPAAVHATVHEDDAGDVRVVFVLNSGAEACLARVSIGGEGEWRDVLTDERARVGAGVLEVPMARCAVRMLAPA